MENEKTEFNDIVRKNLNRKKNNKKNLSHLQKMLLNISIKKIIELSTDQTIDLICFHLLEMLDKKLE